MDNLISRQAALDALGERPMLWINNDEYTLGARNQYDMDRLAIETAPSAQQWIPVTPKTMPKKVGDYLVTTHSGQIARYIYMGNGTSKEYWMRCVAAWMPLPEPYKEHDDD